MTTIESRMAELEAKFAAFIAATTLRLDDYAEDIGAISDDLNRIARLAKPSKENRPSPVLDERGAQERVQFRSLAASVTSFPPNSGAPL